MSQDQFLPVRMLRIVPGATPYLSAMLASVIDPNSVRISKTSVSLRMVVLTFCPRTRVPWISWSAAFSQLVAQRRCLGFTQAK